MNKRTEDIIKNWLPPAVLALYRNLHSRGHFTRSYGSWVEACQASTGYDSDLILTRVEQSLFKVKNGEAGFERDGTLFDKPDYWWPLLSGLLWVASRNGNRLNIIDFGGSLGTTFNQNLPFIRHLDDLQWHIVEQKKFVESGRQHFENEHLKFYHSVDDCMRESHPDAIVFSGVIQYLERPYDLLEDVLSKGFKQILFDRTPFLDHGEKSRITVQKVSPPSYEPSYPAWFFNIEEFLDFFSKDYHLIADFPSLDRFSTMDIKAQSRGFFFEKKKPLKGLNELSEAYLHPVEKKQYLAS